jgi:hypothetical protein
MLVFACELFSSSTCHLVPWLLYRAPRPWHLRGFCFIPPSVNADEVVSFPPGAPGRAAEREKSASLTNPGHILSFFGLTVGEPGPLAHSEARVWKVGAGCGDSWSVQVAGIRARSAPPAWSPLQWAGGQQAPSAVRVCTRRPLPDLAINSLETPGPGSAKA